MASKANILNAYERGKALAAIVKWARNQAEADPTNKRWVEMGLVPDHVSKAEKVAVATKLFDELMGLVEHVKVLDMSASFEIAAIDRVKTRIGGARSSIKEGSKRYHLPAYASRLVHNSKDYSSLKALSNLLEEHIDEELFESFKIVCAARNNFAHGTNILSSPVVEPELARDKLIEVLDAL